MPDPLISIVIPTYNQARFLPKSLGGALAQTYPRSEIIVVNNFSADNTIEVVQGMRDARIRLINFRNHGVIGSSRNVGIRAAAGEYVAFLDSDDFWHPKKLDVVCSVFRERPDTDLVCHNENLVTGEKTTKVLEYGPQGSSLFQSLLFNGSCLSTSATTVRTAKLLEAGLFSESPAIVTAEDYDMWLKLARVCRCVFIKDVLGNFVVHEQSASGNAERHSRSILNVFEAHLAREYGAPEGNLMRLIERRRARIFYGVARRLQQQRAFSKSLAYYVKALRHDPGNHKVYPALLAALLRIAR